MSQSGLIGNSRFAMTDPLLAAPSHFLQPPAPPPPPTPPRNPSCHSLLLRLPRRFKPIRSSVASTSIGINPIPPARWRQKAPVAATAWSGVDEGTPPEGQLDDDVPTSIELVPVASEEQFDRITAEAQQLEESMIVLWMANWCRKCIYLKPKLEKLAADYYPRIRFYCIDVNTVPQRLVNRAGITKMPTIQLWKDSHKQAEVIGGHKAWLVVDDIRRMIENEE